MVYLYLYSLETSSLGYANVFTTITLSVKRQNECRRKAAAAYSRFDTWVINPAPDSVREKNLGSRRDGW